MTKIQFQSFASKQIASEDSVTRWFGRTTNRWSHASQGSAATSSSEGGGMEPRALSCAWVCGVTVEHNCVVCSPRLGFVRIP